MRKVLWVHNFDPGIPNAGSFMHGAYKDLLESKKVVADIYYLGNLRNPLNFIAQVRKVRQMSSDYDFVHAQFGSFCGLVCAFARGARIITLRGSDWYPKSGAGFFSKMHSRLQILGTKISLWRYGSVVVVSNRMRAEVEKSGYKKAIHVLPSPVDTKKFQPLSKMECRVELNLDQEKIYVLFPVMRLSNSVKRPMLVQKVIEELRQHNSKFELMSISGIPHEKMPMVFNAADITLLPSEYEGWPNVIKESLACNTPFVATDVSDLSEIAVQTATCGIAVPSVNSIVDEILQRIAALNSGGREDLRRFILPMRLDVSTNELLDKVYIR